MRRRKRRGFVIALDFTRSEIPIGCCDEGYPVAEMAGHGECLGSSGYTSKSDDRSELDDEWARVVVSQDATS